jgi:hypothetical protein
MTEKKLDIYPQLNIKKNKKIEIERSNLNTSTNQIAQNIKQ